MCQCRHRDSGMDSVADSDELPHRAGQPHRAESSLNSPQATLKASGPPGGAARLAAVIMIHRDQLETPAARAPGRLAPLALPEPNWH